MNPSNIKGGGAMVTDCDVNMFKAVERGNVRKLNEFLVSGGRKGIQKTDPKFNATLLHWASLRNQVISSSGCGVACHRLRI